MEMSDYTLHRPNPEHQHTCPACGRVWVCSHLNCKEGTEHECIECIQQRFNTTPFIN